jgi:hypothetical protein
MADKLQNTTQVTTNVTSKAAMVSDMNSSYLGEESYSYARNAVRNSKDGDLGTIGNEPSNTLCFNTEHKIIGHVLLPDERILIFSTDNSNSEIGIGDPNLCTYTSLLNLPCLNFSQNHPITGVAKRDFQRGTVVTFTDKFNPVRRIELKNISDAETCDDILLFKKIGLPCIKLTKTQVGNVPNGMYSVAISYVVDNQIFSDWYALSDRIALNSETGTNSFDVKIEGLDSEFDQFALVVIGTFIDPETKGVTKLAKQIGIYSTKVKSVSVTDFINSNYIEIPLSNLVIQKRTWSKAGIISSNANYLILGDLVGREEENYQLKAMSIKAEYVVEQLPVNYYEFDGRDVSYYRDENYDFYIQGIYNTGETTDKFHIPGRVAESTDTSIVSGPDVYEYDTQFSDCEPEQRIPRWKVENTAGRMNPNNEEFKCDRRILGRGEFGYHESTDLYPDNEDMFGEWANTPIRYHRFPDECKVPRFSVINGVTYINILGVRFYDIPAFDNPDIVGYKITRSDRRGGNGTVIARGLMGNLRSYQDLILNQTIMYNNYTVNDLSPDQYISSTQTAFRGGRETNFNPLTDYYKDRFAFYSPHTMFEPRYSLGTEIKIESEEIASTVGQFEIVYQHPKQKLLNQFAFWVAAAIGFIETALVILGQQSATGTKTNFKRNLTVVGVVTKVTSDPLIDNSDSMSQDFTIRNVDDLMRLNITQFIQKKIAARDLSAIQIIQGVITLIASLGIKIPYSVFQGMKVADDTFQIIYDFTGFTDYVYQYNAIATFNQSRCVTIGNKRRRLKHPATYIPSTVVSVNDLTLNNLHRERFVYLELNKPISDPSVPDDTRQTAKGFGICDDVTRKTTSTGSMFYATSKIPNPNQYGQLGSSAPVSMHSCPFTGVESPILYGGDCIITRFQFLKKMQFFSQNIAGTNYPPGTEYDYRKYRNIGFPRFWMDSTKYDFSELLGGNRVNFTRFSRTTTSKHNLDCKEGDGRNIARIDDAYMYLYNNAAMDFIVECDYHAEFREKTELPFYSNTNRNLSDIFRSDRIDREEEFVVSRAYADLYPTELFASQQRYDFDPADPIPTTQPNSVIYSLPSFNLQGVDNWQYFLPANYFAFRESDFGDLTGIHKLDQDRIIFLFSKSSPFVSMGRDFLELEQSGRKVTVGDGGLFAQDPREVMPTDNNYGSCTSRYAFANTHLGRYYPSAVQGRILNFTQTLDDIARQGISYWCKNYMPIQFYNFFPNYPKVENPVYGVGYLMAFDSYYETVYISKRDFVPVPELAEDIRYDEETEQFFYRNLQISLHDSNYFKDASWTLSYSPLEKGFVSYHDWHPDWIIQQDNHFLSVKDNGVWKHNEAFDNYCKFYGVDWPFEIEFVSNSGQTVHTVRSVEYLLEVYKYKNFGRDRFHVHHQNFDALIVRNTEQISPLLLLNYSTSDPERDLAFPIRDTVNPVAWKVLFSKEENKYRINQFWDSVKDRGEFTNSEFHLFPTDESGYRNVVNPLAIDVNKPEEQRKKFRHYWNKFRLIKTVSGENKLICKIYNIKKQISPR